MNKKNQTTELVFINSSRPRIAGPTAKVIRRKEEYYMLPRSPTSPTLLRRTRIPPTSGSLTARLKRDYTQTKGISLLTPRNKRVVHHRTNTVSDLEKVEPFVVKRYDYSDEESIGMLTRYYSKFKHWSTSYFLTDAFGPQLSYL